MDKMEQKVDEYIKQLKVIENGDLELIIPGTLEKYDIMLFNRRGYLYFEEVTDVYFDVHVSPYDQEGFYNVYYFQKIK